MRLISALFVAALLTAACGSDGPAPCDPLAGAESPITLATLIGAGTHKDATTYLLDKAGSDYRVFVGSGLELRRKRVAGSGEFTVEVVASRILSRSTARARRSPPAPRR
jgi:hypothetical protein